jgi:hypothetical protein
VTRLPALRAAVGLAAVVLCAVVFASRVRTIGREPRVALSPRVAQLMYNRMLALRIEAYARQYGRPAYDLDSVLAHLDSAGAALVSDLRTDLWGEPVSYFWTWCNFSLLSRAGASPPQIAAAFDSMLREQRARERSFPPLVLGEEYPWPPGVGRTERCFGGR